MSEVAPTSGRQGADTALTELKYKLGQGTYVKPTDKTLAEYAPEIMAAVSPPVGV